MNQRLRLGEIMLRAGVIDEMELQSALGEQKKWGSRLGLVLIRLGYATEQQIVKRSQVAGWAMPIGRLESARRHWEMLWPRLREAFPQIIARKMHRLHFSAAGQEAFVCYQQQIYQPRTADVYCWSPGRVTKQLLMAICDWAYREEYRSLVLALPEATTKLLGQGYEENPYQQNCYAIDIIDTVG